MNKQLSGIRFSDIDNLETKFIKIEDYTTENKIKVGEGKFVVEYIREYIDDEKLFDKINDIFKIAIHKTIPQIKKDECPFCTGGKKDNLKRICDSYQVEGTINFVAASFEFVSIVESNKHLFFEKLVLKHLTIKFIEGFVFREGRVYFDVDGIVKECLKEGISVISKKFAKSSHFDNLNLIYDSIDELETLQLQIDIDGLEEPFYIKHQRKFFENKKKHYESLISLREKEIKFENLEKNRLLKQNQPTVSETVLLHNHIFKNNAFEVWEHLFKEFDINDKSRTDVKFIFEEMKKDKLIYETVNQKSFLDWIFSTYDGLLIQKTSNHNRTANRLRSYSIAKKLYKSQK